MAQRALPLLLMLFAPVVTSHGHLLRAVIKPKDGGADKVACAANANAAECAGSPSVRLRKLIPRSGNDGACKIPPGCELGCPGVTGSKPGGAPCATLGICDHCGLEKVAAEKTQVGTDGSKWWTKMPAAHWDEPDQWPIFPCMSRDEYGAQGKLSVSVGDTVAATIYMNADHSGLYRYELSCGQTATNEEFNKNAITPWKALHPSKELAAGAPPLPLSREVGSTRAETDAYWAKTVCTAAGCPYRMNGAAPQYPGGAFGITSAECKAGGTGPGGTPGPTTTPTCFIEDAFIIPSDTSCRGPATLRWMWNSAEGLETYANCLDIEIQGAGGGGGGGTGGGSGGGGSIGGGSSGSAVSTTGSSNSGTTTIMVLILLALIVGFGYYFYKNKPSPPASSDVVAAPVDVGTTSTPAAPTDTPGLPDGWQKLVDPKSGHPYYYNSANGETQWTMPEAGSIKERV